MDQRRPANAIDPKVKNRVRELRIARGMSIPRLAELTGLDPQKVRRIETGETALRDIDFEIFAEALDVDPTELIPSARPRLSDEARSVAERYQFLDPHLKRAIRAIAEPEEPFRGRDEKKVG